MDSDEECEETAPSYRGIPATIILINVLDLKIAKIAHASTCKIIRQYLRQSHSHYVSVCLFGTDSETSCLGDNNVTDIFPLTMPTTDDCKKLEELDLTIIKQDNEMKMSNALLHCSKLFANSKKKLSSRTVIVLLSLETPPTETDQIPALKRVEDLAETNVNIKLINIGEENKNADDFYIKFLKNASNERDVTLPNPLYNIKEIENLMYQESHRHLAVARLSLEIGEGMSIGVGVYNLIKDGRKQKTSHLNSETNEVVTPKNEIVKVGNEEQAQEMPVINSELIRYVEYGGERVEFTNDEMKTLKNPFGPPMFKLMGFKPASLLSKEKWFLKKGYFLFPNEEIIEGSTTAFKALHQACDKTGMVAICILCTRVNSRPFHVALSPTSQPLGLNIDTGFDVINIPFVESVRNLPEPETPDNEEVNISKPQKIVMKDIINAVKFEYKVEMFDDPKVQSLSRNLEAIAFDDDEVEPFIDSTKPNSENFKNIDDALFHEIFGPFGSVAVKRPSAKEYSTAKKIKTEDVDQSLLQTRLANNKVNQYTVAELKQVLKSKDIPMLPALTGLKKTELVDLVYKHFQ